MFRGVLLLVMCLYVNTLYGQSTYYTDCLEFLDGIDENGNSVLGVVDLTDDPPPDIEFDQNNNSVHFRSEWVSIPSLNHTFTSHPFYVFGLDEVNQKYFYSDFFTFDIYSCDYSGANNTLIKSVSNPILALEYEVISQTIYYTENNIIRSYNPILNIGNPILLVAGIVKALAIDEGRSTIYFVEQSGLGSIIKSCNRDGTNVQTISTINDEVTDIEIDFARQKLVWVGVYTDDLFTCDFDGNNFTSTNAPLCGFGIGVDNGSCKSIHVNQSSIANSTNFQQTAKWIYSTSTILSNSNVRYESNMILLDIGFETNSDSDFLAQINPCSN